MIISERIQKLAVDLPITERLGIKKPVSSPEDIGRYMGLLAAMDHVAAAIGQKNGHKEPSDADYKAAFAAFCLWPPNKPPLAESYWADAIATFGNKKARERLSASVGPLAVELSPRISAGEAEETIRTHWPTDQTDYFKHVLNFRALLSED